MWEVVYALPGCLGVILHKLKSIISPKIISQVSKPRGLSAQLRRAMCFSLLRARRFRRNHHYLRRYFYTRYFYNINAYVRLFDGRGSILLRFPL